MNRLFAWALAPCLGHCVWGMTVRKEALDGFLWLSYSHDWCHKGMLHVSSFSPVYMFLAYRQVCEHSSGQAVSILHMKHPSRLLQKIGAPWEVMGCSSTAEGNTQHFEWKLEKWYGQKLEPFCSQTYCWSPSKGSGTAASQTLLCPLEPCLDS